MKQAAGLLVLLFISMVLIVPVLADEPKTLDQIAAEQKVPIAEHVANFYQWAVGISALIALGIIVYAGLAYIAAGGNTSRQADAKQWIWNALIGLLLLFGSYLILNTINPDLTKLQNIDLSQVKVEQATGTVQEAKNLDLNQLIANFYQWALGIGGLIALGILIFAGILYTISPGNSSRQGEAKTWIFSAILGLALLFGSYAILNTVNPNLTKLVSLKESLEKTEFNAPPTPAPAARGEPPKPGEKVSLGIAEQIGNLYQWALGIGGLIALGVLIFGGILYTISAGNTSRQDDAKSWLFGAVMGILLLFGSFLILNTINPELTKLKDLELIVNEAAQKVENFGFEIVGDIVGFKKEVFDFLQVEDRVNAEAWMAIIACETGFDPNSVNPNSTCAQQGYCTGGACGLLQMRCDCKGSSPYDCGKTDWQTQVKNGIGYARTASKEYWDCADGVRGDGDGRPSLLK